MRRLRRFVRLPRAERSLLLRAIVLLVAVRLALAVLPLRRLRAWLAAGLTAVRPSRRGVSKERVAWAVSTAGRVVPGATCLALALTGEALLTRMGHTADLCIGVAKAPTGDLDAHAWVESDGDVLIGGLADLRHYTRLPPLPADRQ